MSARKAHENPPVTLRSKKRVRFQEEQPTENLGEESDGGQGRARPRSEWRPDQAAATEGAKRQRLEQEDAEERESKDTGGSSGSDDTTPRAGGVSGDDEFDEGRTDSNDSARGPKQSRERRA